jgi:hypothetical protein
MRLEEAHIGDYKPTTGLDYRQWWGGIRTDSP